MLDLHCNLPNEPNEQYYVLKWFPSANDELWGFHEVFQFLHNPTGHWIPHIDRLINCLDILETEFRVEIRTDEEFDVMYIALLGIHFATEETRGKDLS